MNRIDFPFEDLPLIRQGEFVALRASGTAVITYTRSGNWAVESLSLDGDNNRPHPHGQGGAIELTWRDHEALWKLIEDALSRECKADIIDRIAADLPDRNAEHRLTARDLGVGRFGHFARVA